MYNPQGWNLPKTSDMRFISRQIKHYSGIAPDIEIEEYRENDRETRDEYFILNNVIKGKKKTDLRSYIREYPLRLKIFRILGKKEILFYLYDRLAEYMPRSELETTAKGRAIIANIVPVDWLSSYIVDLNNDGLYETMYDSFFIDMDEEKSLIYVLNIKLDVLKKGGHFK